MINNDQYKKHYGDMPGDKVTINEEHINKAKTIFQHLMLELLEAINRGQKLVISIYGGSGVGKSEIATLIGYYFENEGIRSYTLSGDNYPHRIPSDNDFKRENIYEQYGEKGLWQYLGSPEEINFDEVNNIIDQFKSDKDMIRLKRMGRTPDELWYEDCSFKGIQILIIEWTHGNSDYLKGIDFPIYLNSTPEETLAHRRKRQRDGQVDSPLVNKVLKIEQSKLQSQVKRAKMIVSKKGKILALKDYNMTRINNGPMLNLYPDSIECRLSGLIDLLKESDFQETFSSLYLLPSCFNTDLDRGFSIIDYQMNQALVKSEDLQALKKMKMTLKLDFILNHLSVLSPQFQEVLKWGDQSQYHSFFINWNSFWQGKGTMTEEGYIEPQQVYMKDMFFRKPGLPLLMIHTANGQALPFWNTFYNEVNERKVEVQDLVSHFGIQYYTAEKLAQKMNQAINQKSPIEAIDFGICKSKKKDIIKWMHQNRLYLGQMDLNTESEAVWQFYEKTIKQLANYGAQIIRLDAFAYASKVVGKKNFFNEPETWQMLDKLDQMASRYGTILLPEIHSSYQEGLFKKIADRGYMTYDFFLPGLVIDALESGNPHYLVEWAREQYTSKIRTVNMLGCHDGIPVLDLKGILSEERIFELIQLITSRGGIVKNLHGQKNIYYQVNATYYSALGKNDSKLLLARAIQLFMPGKPQIWYLDLFAGENDYEAVAQEDSAGHKAINRSNLSRQWIDKQMKKPLVKQQLQMIHYRNTCPAFDWQSQLTLKEEGSHLSIKWTYRACQAELRANLKTLNFEIRETNKGKQALIFSTQSL